ncbi:MAG: hypothetical protein KA163_08920 [Bacteroidia bacterium]|nr:hypothetical protein [Bacteroidia bacterium]
MLNNTIHKLATAFAITICLFGLSCQSKKINSTPAKANEKTAFYDFKFIWDSISKKSQITVNTINVANTKSNFTQNNQGATLPNNVLIEITDKDGNNIKEHAEHPLAKKYDVFSENGEIEAKLVSLPEGNFIIRVPYYSDWKKIKITETIKGVKQTAIILKNEK